jgi:ABC-2 type transport system ATP-binding protein
LDAGVVATAILCDGVTKAFGSVRAVDALSFGVERGEIVGFLGPNGAGKTTTIRMLLDLARPSAGRVEVLGVDPRSGGARLRRRIGYVPGDLVMYDKLTGRQMLEFVASLRRVDERLVVAGALAEQLDVDLDRPLGTLSRGNRQKIGVIQALAHEPDVLVLDEPTSGLDPVVQRTFRTLVRAAADRGAAVLLSSHVLAEVQRLVDRVAIIRAGRLVTIEPMRELEAKALRVVEIRFASPVARDAFVDLPGVRSVEIDGDLLRASVAGSVDALVKTASRFRVESIAGHEADLEDVFLTYYGDTRDAAA